MGGTSVYPCPIHVDVWQKPSQYCNYPPIKMNILILKDKKMYNHLENLPAASCLC